MARIPQEQADRVLSELSARYRETKEAIPVSFRDLLAMPKEREKATHGIHAYPARLLVNIPSFFLSTSLSAVGDTVLDPFCGSGTVLLESILANRNAIGADSNPLARLITKTKTTRINQDSLRVARKSLVSRLQLIDSNKVPDVLNVDYWYYPCIKRDLAKIYNSILKFRRNDIRDFFLTSFSACIKEVSLADPRLSVPVKLKEKHSQNDSYTQSKIAERLKTLKKINTVEIFLKKVDDNIQRMHLLTEANTASNLIDILHDARQMDSIIDSSIDLIITSPPYLGAQKYIRASSLSLTWLELCKSNGLRDLESKNIGREHYSKSDYFDYIATGIAEIDNLIEVVRSTNPLRAHIAAQYINEMKEAIKEMSRVLKPGKHLVLVSGEGSLVGFKFRTPDYLAKLARDSGLRLCVSLVDTIRSRALMTKRNKTAGKIDTETIMVFQKV